MGDVEELVAEAWARLRSILNRAEHALRAGADLASVDRVVTATVSRMEDIEAYALIADEQAVEAIQRAIAELEELRDSLPRVQDG